MLIGLGGYAQAGKDTVADILVERHGFVKKYMSAPLELALLRVNPWVNVNWDNWKDGTWQKCELWTKGFLARSHMRYVDLHARVGYDVSKNNTDVRDYLQKLGTEVGRNMFGEDVWIDYAFGEISKLLDAGQSVALTGIRFPNELERVTASGGDNVWVRRPGFGPVNAHTSDNTLVIEDFDWIVDNDGTVEDLESTVSLFLSEDDLVPA